MITLIASIVGCALLFGLFAALRPRAGCDGHCAGCTGERCPLAERTENHV